MHLLSGGDSGELLAARLNQSVNLSSPLIWKDKLAGVGPNILQLIQRSGALNRSPRAHILIITPFVLLFDFCVRARVDDLRSLLYFLFQPSRDYIFLDWVHQVKKDRGVQRRVLDLVRI